MPVTQEDLQENHITNSDGKKGCGKGMLPLAVSSYRPTSEWYCLNCHDSVRMAIPVADVIIGIERKQSGGKQGS